MQELEIPWHIEKHPNNSTKLIVIDRCPVCGKPGRLVKEKHNYRIRHNTNRHYGCRIGKTSPYYEKIDEIYRSVRKC
ncbi:hypothetical protein DRP04_15500 [Archaeoglobales archaeon]|nr:MAG: hypothetical protein DRP04_15500 [Archaeoglobales archaeon]